MEKITFADAAPEAETREFDAEWFRRASHERLQRQLVALLRERRTDLDEGPMLLDAHVYTDERRFEAERRELFLKRPILAALSRDLPEPGDSFVFDELGPPIVLVRNGQGRVNAFMNICTHRAARLVSRCDRKQRLSCPFHGWTFDLDGDLVGVPGKEGFDGMDTSARRLIRVPVAEWHGLIFVKGEPGEGPIDVERHLGAMAPELMALELAYAEPVKRSRIDVRSNWKYALDTYGESYHFATVHSRTVGNRSFSNIMAYRELDGHHRLGFPRAELQQLVDMPEARWPEARYGGLYYLFPNVVIQVGLTGTGEPFYGVSRLFPGANVNSCATLRTTYKPHYVAAESDIAAWEEAHDFADLLIDTEDYPLAASGQRNLQYLKDFRIVLGANEIALQRIHRRIDAILRQSAATTT